MNTLELFCGAAKFTKVFSQPGYINHSFDIRFRRGVCEPTIRGNILDYTAEDFRKLYNDQPIHAVWASIPCPIFSYGSGDHYFRDHSYSEKALYFLNIAKHTLQILTDLKPVYFFIENPRGRLYREKFMIDWIIRNNGMIKECTLSSYGFPTTKPTHIFTNFYALELKPMAKYGRGNKSAGHFGKMTTVQRQSTPEALFMDIKHQLGI